MQALQTVYVILSYLGIKYYVLFCLKSEQTLDEDLEQIKLLSECISFGVLVF